MRAFIKLLTIVVIVLITVTLTSSFAKNYVSLSGEFYFNLPDDWVKIDYPTVDLYLAQNNVGDASFYYDAVFAPKTNDPFYNGEYLFLTYDKIGQLSDKQIDSVLATMTKLFGEDLKYFPVANYLTDLKSNAPNYDKEKKIVSVLNDVSQKAESFKKNLLMFKFYNRGIAKFFFYSPDSLFETSKNDFYDMVNTFSDENVDAALPKENVKIADIETGTDSDDGSSNGSKVAIFVAIAVVLFIVIKKRKKARS